MSGESYRPYMLIGASTSSQNVCKRMHCVRASECNQTTYLRSSMPTIRNKIPSTNEGARGRREGKKRHQMFKADLCQPLDPRPKQSARAVRHFPKCPGCLRCRVQESKWEQWEQWSLEEEGPQILRT
ncbi:hypothetical protein Mp_1g24200 [Marchantia polymorpha subsp. ruderalis]|uniref:Uncharacterized protein n=2 Tax=Marchantia polymorpha TaxID=3197 RepID=A0AAF6ATR1_MARPO|nr:hypothetical protein MARPO_0061s0101 [Marchantia polymorpha]BBM99831.1 hypothetical protein Mp_1g24200 [Marchantia polymorpha subsp. ruderalis]|eukprot:PTQ36854.1 hypothetical protein MARPO_0061s0101 [Marchantia polymorpha]